MRRDQKVILTASAAFLIGIVAGIVYAEIGHRQGLTNTEPNNSSYAADTQWHNIGDPQKVEWGQLLVPQSTSSNEPAGDKNAPVKANNITINVNGSTAYDNCLSRNWNYENWTSSHYMHCRDTLKLCQNSESCLITYKANRSNHKYAHFRAQGDPIYLPWQIKLNQYTVPGFLTLGTNYPNTTHYDKNSVGWNIWKDGLEKRRQLTNRSNSIQIDSAAQIKLDTSTQYKHTWELSQDDSSYFCQLQNANLTDNSGTLQCHSKEAAAEQLLNKTEVDR